MQDLEVIEPTIPVNVELDDSSFAYQGIVGISTCLNARTEMFVEYRFFETAEFSLDVGTPIGSANFTTDTTSHDVMFGLRIKRQ
jgi:opacity protein-like surface antigen